MSQLNFERFEFEVTNRLRGTLNSVTAERILRDRCINAVKLRNIDKAKVFNKIHLYFSSDASPVRVIQTSQIITTLKGTGVLDLISICINAQKEEEI